MDVMWLPVWPMGNVQGSWPWIGLGQETWRGENEIWNNNSAQLSTVIIQTLMQSPSHASNWRSLPCFYISYVHPNLENMGDRYNPVKVDELVLDVNFPCSIGYKPRGIRLLPSNHCWPKLFPNPGRERGDIYLSCPISPRPGQCQWSQYT